MKNSLLAGLLKNTALNANQDMERVALFEIGKAFGRERGQDPGRQTAGRQRLWAAAEKRLALPRGSIRFFLFQVPAGPARQAPAPGICLQKTRAPGLCRFLLFRHRDRRPPLRLVRRGQPGILPLLQAGQAGLSRPRSTWRPCSRPCRRIVSAMWKRFPAVRRDFTFLMAKTVSYEELSAASSVCGPRSLKVTN